MPDNQNLTAGSRGPLLAQDVWLHEKLGNFAREVIPERRMPAKGSGACGTLTVTHDITNYTRARIFAKVGKQTEMFACSSPRLTSAARPSHTYSFINADNERWLVKFHLVTQQGIKNLTDAAAAEVVSSDRESKQRDLYDAIEQGDFPSGRCTSRWCPKPMRKTCPTTRST